MRLGESALQRLALESLQLPDEERYEYVQREHVKVTGQRTSLQAVSEALKVVEQGPPCNRCGSQPTRSFRECPQCGEVPLCDGCIGLHRQEMAVNADGVRHRRRQPRRVSTE